MISTAMHIHIPTSLWCITQQLITFRLTWIVLLVMGSLWLLLSYTSTWSRDVDVHCAGCHQLVSLLFSASLPYGGFVSSDQTFGFFLLQASKTKIKRTKSEYYLGVTVHRIRQNENKTDEVGFFSKARKFGHTNKPAIWYWTLFFL